MQITFLLMNPSVTTRPHGYCVCGVFCLLQLFEVNRVKFYMLNEVSEMIGHHGQVFRKWEKQHDMMLISTTLSCLIHGEDESDKKHENINQN